MAKDNYKNDWEEFAEIDSKWSILTNSEMRYDGWSEKNFFDTGVNEIEKTLKLIKTLQLNIHFGQVLDFGCGIGRVTYALSRYFQKVYGVDISEKMIAQAKAKFKENPKIIFKQNEKNNLEFFNDSEFDFIFSLITLQHVPDKKRIESYLLEFLRILKTEGLLYFQLPSIPNYSLHKKILLKFRSRLYYLFTDKLRFSKKFCYYYLKLAPFMHMSYVKSSDIKRIFTNKDQRIKINVFNDNSINTAYLIQKTTEYDKSNNNQA